ncbi:chitin deacetylase [Linnemannia exigua]|uniref:chitin deacetylase n=1 Tax=Linnemannia exigua TaxID=604196 RepID=A0AAD4D8P7_9FUNG|nr:chitin deacetylase [Linnemannia exigua]
MVKILPTLLALSATLSVVLGYKHGHSHDLQILQKRGTSAPEPTGCPAYAPIASGAWPTLDCIPYPQDPQVQQWLKLVDMAKVPVYPPSNDGLCPAAGTTIPAGQCWWTCQKCTAPDDITFCPQTGTWGLTYDDGPSPDSPRLYDDLKAHSIQATLFIVGSRAISYPATLQRAYNEGHQIAIHTWSHPSMTSLSNEQIVAELKWTEKAIVSVIGVTPIYWRPPYGDVDNRVRAIATQLGYKTSIWTDGFDTNDWNIPAGTATPQSVVATFQTWLAKIPTMPNGFIVLEHDLFPAEVNVSINGILPIAFADKALKMMPIARCMGDAKPYKEGAGTFSLAGSPASSTTSAATGHSGTATAGGATATSGSASASTGGPNVHVNSAPNFGSALSMIVMTGSAAVLAVL